MRPARDAGDPVEVQRKINDLVDRGLLERRLNDDGEWEYHRRTPLGDLVMEEATGRG